MERKKADKASTYDLSKEAQLVFKLHFTCFKHETWVDTNICTDYAACGAA